MNTPPANPAPASRYVLRDNLLVGLVALLPIAVLVLFFRWLYVTTTELISPLTKLMVQWSGLGSWLADFVVLGVLVLTCYFVGLLIRTKIGKPAIDLFSRMLLRKVPGYRLVKDTISQFIRTDKASPFSKVALVKFYQDDIGATAFVTAEHENGYYTVFVPTGPNPTSGLMFHVPASRVVLLEGISVDTAMRSVIGCGVGAQPIVAAAMGQKAPENDGSFA